MPFEINNYKFRILGYSGRLAACIHAQELAAVDGIPDWHQGEDQGRQRPDQVHADQVGGATRAAGAAARHRAQNCGHHFCGARVHTRLQRQDLDQQMDRRGAHRHGQ